MLTPLQFATLDQLRPPRDEREPADLDAVDDLRNRLDEALTEIADRCAEGPDSRAEGPDSGGGNQGGDRPDLVVTKRKLALVHGCERHLVETDDDFSWSVPAARGTVTHKAIELFIYRRGEPTPIDLAEEAIAALEAEGNRSIGSFLADLGEPHRTGLLADVARLVDSFVSMFPPLPRSWRPVAEGSIRVSAAAGRVQLLGKPDLTLGGPQGDVPGRVIVDLKTGSPTRTHRDDLRFYSLLDTLRNGVPPLKVASAFLDSGTVEVENVDGGTLEAALRRTIDGAARLAELAAGEREPTERAGPMCRWCPVLDSCATGRVHADPDVIDDLP